MRALLLITAACLQLVLTSCDAEPAQQEVADKSEKDHSGKNLSSLKSKSGKTASDQPDQIAKEHAASNRAEGPTREMLEELIADMGPGYDPYTGKLIDPDEKKKEVKKNDGTWLEEDGSLVTNGTTLSARVVKKWFSNERSLWLLTHPKERTFEETTEMILKSEYAGSVFTQLLRGQTDPLKRQALIRWAGEQDSTRIWPTSYDSLFMKNRFSYETTPETDLLGFETAVKVYKAQGIEALHDYAKPCLRYKSIEYKKRAASLLHGATDRDVILELMLLTQWKHEAALPALKAFATCKPDKDDPRFHSWSDIGYINDYLVTVASAGMTKSLQLEALRLLAKANLSEVPEDIYRVHKDRDPTVAALAKKLFPKK